MKSHPRITLPRFNHSHAARSNVARSNVARSQLTGSHATLRRVLAALSLALCFVAALFLATLFFPAHLSTVQAQESPDGRTFLPLVSKPPSVAPAAFAGTPGCEDTPNANDYRLSPATLAYGFDTLHVATAVGASAGTAWRLEWTINGDRIKALDSAGTIAENPDLIATSIIRVRTRSGTVVERCFEPIQRGTYEIDIFLDGVLYEEGRIFVE